MTLPPAPREPDPRKPDELVELAGALSALNRAQPRPGLEHRVLARLQSPAGRRATRDWRVFALAPAAISLLLLFAVYTQRGGNHRPVAPQGLRTQAPSRVIVVPETASGPQPRIGGKKIPAFQPQPVRDARVKPPVPFAYPRRRSSPLHDTAPVEAKAMQNSPAAHPGEPSTTTGVSAAPPQ